jgi:copper chaperone CopZ
MHAALKSFPKRMQNQQDQRTSKSRSGSSSQTLRKTHTSQSEQHETDEGDDGTVEVELNVRGMKCDGCRSSVEQALLAVASVDNVRVDIDSGKAIVSVKARTLHYLLKLLPCYLCPHVRFHTALQAPTAMDAFQEGTRLVDAISAAGDFEADLALG